METDLDLLIIGAGCAGLSLGAHLAKMKEDAPKVLLLEQRKVYENDRTWCFWGLQENAYSGLVNHQWGKLVINSEKESITLDCSSAPYQILSSNKFYEEALQWIGLNPLIDLRMNSVLSKEPELHQGWWHFETNFGQARAKSVVDTRPKARHDLKHTKLWQSFMGYEIECDQAQFDSNTAVLMDFYKANSEFVGFSYVLPQTEKRALVEFTVFAKQPYLEDDLVDMLEEAVIQHSGNKSYRILRKEFGIIPMGLSDGDSSLSAADSYPSYIYAGLTAGAARPATGYAFQRIQNWAIQCGNSLSKNFLPATHVKDNLLLRMMDDIFLNVIRNNPELGPALFMALFSKVNSKRVIRFLADKGRLLDYLSVIKALPAAPFLKNIFKVSPLK
jgi:lycopene beta-cyclase